MDDSEVQQIIKDAQLARQEGHMVFTAVAVKGLYKEAYTAWDISGLIEGVERQGWLLAHTSEMYVGIGTGNLRMTCVFRRHDW
ncbi:hypothetical protein AB0J63_32220 [Streptosporangium canum]|uniref:hypothetical protein n=1 Tax=Streptosporangium canum TaxID=324952 RepID=UPI003442CF24